LLLSLNLKSDDDNYLIQQQQVLAIVREFKLLHFLDRSCTPLNFQYLEDAHNGIVSYAFLNFEQQDQLLVAWLLAFITTPILTKMVGLHTANQIWDKLGTYYATQTWAKVRKLKL